MDLIELLQQRDERAFILLRERYGGYCYCIVSNLLQNEQEAEEALSDVWLQIWNSIPPARKSESISCQISAQYCNQLHKTELRRFPLLFNGGDRGIGGLSARSKVGSAVGIRNTAGYAECVSAKAAPRRSEAVYPPLLVW